MNWNSMDYWLDICRRSGLPIPETHRLAIRDDVNILKLMDAWPKSIDGLFTDDACRIIDSLKYPLFLRSDESADKHSYKNSCMVGSPERLLNNMYNIAEMNFMADLWPRSFYVREMLNVDAAFTAFNGGLPIGVEVRTFLYRGKVVCMHPYWPAGAFDVIEKAAFDNAVYECSMLKDGGKAMLVLGKDAAEPMMDIKDIPAEVLERQRTSYGAPAPGWQQKLAGQYATIIDESNIIYGMAQRLARTIKRMRLPEQYWSADLLRDVYGTWWLTDMALGQHSYHFEGCVRQPKYERLARLAARRYDIDDYCDRRQPNV